MSRPRGIERESDLSEPVSRWLRRRRLRVYAEVALLGNVVDLVGLNRSRIVVVELKRSLTAGVIWQARRGQLWGDEAYAAVATHPKQRTLQACRDHGVGVLQVHGNGRVYVVVEPNPAAHPPYDLHKERLRRQVRGMRPGGVGGLASAAYAPAKAVAREVAPLWRAGTPWRDIYDKVPNHYSGYRSMRSALLGNPDTARILKCTDESNASA